MLALLAWILAELALAFGNGAGYVPPAAFVDGMRADGAPVIRADFVGLSWRCGDELCYAGAVNLPADARADGAPGWTLETGP